MALRRQDGALDSRIPYTDALSMAFCGEIEAVCSSSGKIRYFRVLPAEARPQEVPALEDEASGSSTAIAHTHLGVYREPVREVAVQEYLGFRYASATGEIVGHVWTHCGLR